MSNDKAFEHLLTAVRTRESSTLVITTVATSASLILLGLKHDAIDPSFLAVLGIVSPLLGFFYREITIATIDQEDYDKIYCRMDYSEKTAIDRSDLVKLYGKVRGIIFRVFLLIAPIAWAFVLTENPIPQEFKLGFGGLWIGIAILGAYLANKVEYYFRDSHEKRRKATLPSIPTPTASRATTNWFEGHLWIVIPLIGAVLFAVGITVFFQESNVQPTKVITGHYTIARTDSLIVDGLQTVLLTTSSPQKIWINYQMRLKGESDEGWMLLVTFPFRVQASNDAINKGWKVVDVENSNSIAILSNNTLSSDFECCLFNTEFLISGSMSESNFGQYTLVLPITSSPLSENVFKTVEESSKDARIGWYSDPLHIDIVLDPSVQITQSFPPFEDMLVLYNEKTQSNVKQISWRLDRPQTIVVQYIQPNEFREHQVLLQISGVMIGVGISMMASTAIARTLRFENK